METDTLGTDRRSGSQKPRWRRRYLIDTHAQGRFLTATLLYLIVFSFLLILILLFPGLERLSEDGWTALELNLSGDRGQFIIDRFLPSLFIYLILVTAHSIVMTHRLFGPIYHIEQRMIEMAEGDMASTIHFRKHDFLRGLDITINRAIASVGEEMDQIIIAEEHLASHIDKVLGAVQTGNLSSQNMAHTLKAIQQQHEQTTQTLKSFRNRTQRGTKTFQSPDDAMYQS